MDSAQPRRLNNTTEGVENPTQSWDNNAAVYYISREWLDPTEFLLSSLFILFLLFWVILIDFELDCPILRAFIERERRAGGRPFQCRVHSRLCDVHLLHHLRSRYIEEGSADEYIPFFLLRFLLFFLSLFFYYIITAIIFIFLTLTRTGSEPMAAGHYCVWQHNTVVRLTCVYFQLLNKIK